MMKGTNLINNRNCKVIMIAAQTRSKRGNQVNLAILAPMNLHKAFQKVGLTFTPW